jgi:hypothetical protein
MDKFYKGTDSVVYKNPILSKYPNGSLTEITESDAHAQLAINNAPPELSAEQIRSNAMLAGVEFEGVMCSAFKEDQWGLSSVRAYVLAGSEIPFKFVNQNVIILNDENLAAFEAVWIPFRASFFVI